MSIVQDLIFDIGMHTGVDADFYLKKGFRVVGVEANPLLADAATRRFAPDIAERRLFVEACGIFNKELSLEFYVNEDCDEWSSFHRHLGTRKGTRFHTVDVECRRLDYFVQKYGIPYYLKIDVEGVDAMVVRDMNEIAGRPAYVSVEDGGIDTLIALYEAGVRWFKFINQLEIRKFSLPLHARDGTEISHVFGESSSGPFGPDLPGQWLLPDEAFKYYLEFVRPPGHPPVNGWWDIHGIFEPEYAELSSGG